MVEPSDQHRDHGELLHALAEAQRDPNTDPAELARLHSEAGKIKLFHIHTHKDGQRVG